MSAPLQTTPLRLALLFALLCAGCGSGGDSSKAGVGSTAAVSDQPGHLPAAALDSYLTAHPGTLVLDVRTPAEWNDDLGHLEGATLIPVDELPGRIGELAAWRDKPVVTVCRVGVRSARAAQLLSSAGFTDVRNLEGGMAAYRQAER